MDCDALKSHCEVYGPRAALELLIREPVKPAAELDFLRWLVDDGWIPDKKQELTDER